MIENIDNFVDNFINSYLRCAAMDKIMVFFTKLGDFGIIWIGIAIVLLFFKRFRHYGFLTLGALGLSAIVGSYILKPLVGRLRPYIAMDITNLLITPPGGFSFPSGHTFTAFASAVVLLGVNKKLGISALVIAFLIGFSRIYLYAHYATDVICGCAFGIGIGILLNCVYKKCVTIHGDFGE